jgi:hypothetical protein
MAHCRPSLRASEHAKNRRISTMTSTDVSFSIRLCMISTAASAAATASARVLLQPPDVIHHDGAKLDARAATVDL